MKHLAAVTAAVLLSLGLAACGSSATKSGAGTTTTGASGSGSCPFSGGLETQTNSGYPAGQAAELTSAAPTQSGCIDQVKFNFNGALPPSTVGYTNSSATNQLIIQLGVAVPPNNVPSTVSYTGPATLPTTGLQHVEKMEVGSANGVVTITMTLDKQGQFLVSVSQVPKYLVVSVV